MACLIISIPESRIIFLSSLEDASEAISVIVSPKSISLLSVTLLRGSGGRFGSDLLLLGDTINPSPSPIMPIIISAIAFHRFPISGVG